MCNRPWCVFIDKRREYIYILYTNTHYILRRTLFIFYWAPVVRWAQQGLMVLDTFIVDEGVCLPYFSEKDPSLALFFFFPYCCVYCVLQCECVFIYTLSMPRHDVYGAMQCVQQSHPSLHALFSFRICSSTCPSSRKGKTTPKASSALPSTIPERTTPSSAARRSFTLFTSGTEGRFHRGKRALSVGVLGAERRAPNSFNP